MRTFERSCGDVIILDLHGALTARVVDVGLWHKVTDLSRRGRHKLILNMAEATSSGPFGITTLLGAVAIARQYGGEVKLLHVTRYVDDLPLLVSLYDHFAVFDCEQDALASFNEESEPRSIGGFTACRSDTRECLGAV